MDLRVFGVDAFTDKAFGGNPAAVVEVESWPDTALLRRIAGENALPATAFFRRTGPARADLRWFTPSAELDLCGHATLATGHVLYRELGQPPGPVAFDTQAGTLEVRLREARIEIDLPSRPASAAQAPEGLLAALRTRPAEVYATALAWLCVYESAEQVLCLEPDHAALAATALGRFIATAPGRDCDFVSRFFAPQVGIREDSVTGSSHCTLIPFWSGRLQRSQLHARQLSRRGGELWCEDCGERVRLAGNGVTYLRGLISL